MKSRKSLTERIKENEEKIMYYLKSKYSTEKIEKLEKCMRYICSFLIFINMCIIIIQAGVFAENLQETMKSEILEVLVSSENDNTTEESLDDDVKIVTNTIDEFQSEVSNLGDQHLKSDSQFSTKRLIVISSNEQFENYNPDSVVNYGNLYVLQYNTEDETQNAYNNLKASEEIQMVEIDIVMEAEENITNENNIQESSNQIETELKKYLDSLNSTKDIKVAILDTGINKSKEIFNNKIIDLGINLSSSGSENSITDDNGHGTEMATIILENASDKVKLMPIKVANSEGKATVLNTYLGLLKAIDNNANVINISMNTTESSQSQILTNAINEATQKGIQVIVSAGNNGKNTSNVTPSNIDSAIVVSAINKDNTFANYSNFGNTVDYSAYGEYNGKTGTSYSAASVTGIIADVLSKGQNIDILDKYAIDLGDNGVDNYFGKGLVSLTYNNNKVNEETNNDETNNDEKNTYFVNNIQNSEKSNNEKDTDLLNISGEITTNKSTDNLKINLGTNAIVDSVTDGGRYATNNSNNVTNIILSGETNSLNINIKNKYDLNYVYGSNKSGNISWASSTMGWWGNYKMHLVGSAGGNISFYNTQIAGGMQSAYGGNGTIADFNTVEVPKGSTVNYTVGLRPDYFSGSISVNPKTDTDYSNTIYTENLTQTHNGNGRNTYNGDTGLTQGRGGVALAYSGGMTSVYFGNTNNYYIAGGGGGGAVGMFYARLSTDNPTNSLLIREGFIQQGINGFDADTYVNWQGGIYNSIPDWIISFGQTILGTKNGQTTVWGPGMGINIKSNRSYYSGISNAQRISTDASLSVVPISDDGLGHAFGGDSGIATRKENNGIYYFERVNGTTVSGKNSGDGSGYIYCESKKITLRNPTKTGYIFNGWTCNSNATQVNNGDGTTTFTITDNNSEITANWIPITYYIAYNGNGETSGSTHTFDIAKQLTKNGYKREYTVTYN